MFVSKHKTGVVLENKDTLQVESAEVATSLGSQKQIPFTSENIRECCDVLNGQLSETRFSKFFYLVSVNNHKIHKFIDFDKLDYSKREIYATLIALN